MAFDRPTISEIYNRIKADMESRVTDGVKIPRVSLLGIINIVFSGSIFLSYGFLEWIYKQIFVDTADGEGIIRWGNILGIPQKAAEFTTGLVALTGTTAYTVVTGTLIQNADGLEYETQADFIIGTTASVEVEALEAGAAYNTAAATLSLSAPDGDVDTDVTVVSGFDDGVDVETVDDWVNRLLQRFQNPPSSGTTSDYERWGLEVDGVGKTWAFGADDYLGSGTVGLYVSDSDLVPVSAGILSDVETYVDAVKPVGSKANYLNIVSLDTEYWISINPNTSTIQSEIVANLQELHLDEAEPGGTILLSHIRAAIAASTVDDYEITDIEVDGTSIGAANIVTVKPNTAVYDTVNFASI